MDFILSTLRYLIITESKFQSCWSHFPSWGLSSCMTIWIDLPLLSGLSPATVSALTCTMSWSGWSLCIPYKSCCRQATASLGVSLSHRTYNCPPTSASCGSHCLVFVYYIWWSQIIWPLLYHLKPPSALTMLLLFEPIAVPFHLQHSLISSNAHNLTYHAFIVQPMYELPH